MIDPQPTEVRREVSASGGHGTRKNAATSPWRMPPFWAKLAKRANTNNQPKSRH
jgi:hypothetical protein